VLATGDIFSNGRYPNIDFANGGGINGMIAATETYLTRSDDTTKIVPGHGPLATKELLAEFHDMLLVARERIRRLYDAYRKGCGAPTSSSISQQTVRPEVCLETHQPSMLPSSISGLRTCQSSKSYGRGGKLGAKRLY
jgi:glyoxylase-like metal-dependent hydrolase (beta-lactamase superfamily II)